MEDQKDSRRQPNIDQAIYGLNTDNVTQQIKPGTLTYALNAQVESLDGNKIAYQNEQSNILSAEFKPGFRVIGFHSIPEQNRIILFLANPKTGDSEIGQTSGFVEEDSIKPGGVINKNYVNNGYNICDKPSDNTTNPTLPKKPFRSDYKALLNARCLGFDVHYPVHQIVHRYETGIKTGTEIYWPQVNFPRRFINLDHLPFKEDIADCDRIPTDEVDCSLMEVQPTIQLPLIVPVDVTDDGSIPAGTVQFAVQYANENAEGYTPYYSVTNPLGLFRSQYGLDYDFDSNKSVKLNISNLDLKFQFFNLAVIKTFGGVSSVDLAGTYEILKDTRDVTYSGSDKTPVKLSIEDIFQKYPFYEEARNVAVADDVILWSDLHGSKRVNYQSIASKIRLQWETTQIAASPGYKDGINTSQYHGYMRDEVYALEFVPILRHGEQKDGFHIPSRKAVSTDLDLVTNDDVIGALTLPKHKVYNTGTVIAKDTRYLAAPDTSVYTGPYEYGEFAYWESEKKYPCNKKVWGDLADQPIRHHKFPDNSITHIHDSNPNSADQAFEHKIFPIGIRVDAENIRQAILTSNLSDKEKENIVGYKIVRSDRTNNKSVIAKGLLYNVGAYKPIKDGEVDSSEVILYPNYPFNDLGSDPFITDKVRLSEGDIFDVGLLDKLADAVKKVDQKAENISSSFAGLNPVSYWPSGAPPLGSPTIKLSPGDVSAIVLSTFFLKLNDKSFHDYLDTLLKYYDDKTQEGKSFCSSDVSHLTVDVTTYNALLAKIDLATGATAWTNLQNTINYIDNPDNNVGTNYEDDVIAIYDLRVALQDAMQSRNDLIAAKARLEAAYTAYLSTLADLYNVDCNSIIESTSGFSKTKFTFHSPDTSFYQPFLGDVLKFETLEGGAASGKFFQVKNHAGNKLMSAFSGGLALTAGIALGILFGVEPRQYTVSVIGSGFTFYAPSTLPPIAKILEKSIFWNKEFKEMIMHLIPYKNYAYQYSAVGFYNQFNAIPNNGFKQRSLDKAYYLSPGLQSVGDISQINNWNRESSVYLVTQQDGTSTPLEPKNTSILGSLKEDSSRVPYSSDSNIVSDILSYYASQKRNLIDQYGDIYSYDTVDTGFQGLVNLKQDQTGITYSVFGGDVFINRFGLKRKLSYFVDTLVDKPDGTDIEYSVLSNVGRVVYWYNTSPNKTPNSGTKGLMKSLLGAPQSNLKGGGNKLFYQDGKMFLYSYGIAYFFVESEVNVDYRQAGNAKEKDFYPNIGTGIPTDWVQETINPIVHDNYYLYNKTYSKQNKENLFTHLPLGWNEKEDFSYRVVYSDPGKWRIYKPISYFDFPKNYGKLTSIDTIENAQIMVRFENKSFMYNVLQAIHTASGKTAYMGNDDLFKSQHIDFGDSDFGYSGSQHKLFLKTQNGSLFIDAKRKTVFMVTGNKVVPLSEQGNKSWFDRNLDFEIAKYFPDVDTDNAYNGIGYSGVYDNKYDRFIISKVDYEPLRDDIKYEQDTGRFYTERVKVIPGEIVTTCVCPEGYEKGGNGICVKDNRTLAVSAEVSELFVAAPVSYNLYSKYGTKVFDVFSTDGTGSYEQIPTSNHYWTNYDDNVAHGPMNRVAIWNGTGYGPMKKWVTVTLPITTTEEKTYYVGVGVDNHARIKVGCNVIIDTTSGAIDGDTGAGTSPNFLYWNVYPVVIPKGTYYLEISGWNVSGEAGFGVEVYDNTKDELFAATSPEDLNILFSTENIVGQTISNFNYNCPGDECAPVIIEDGIAYCGSIESTDEVCTVSGGDQIVKIKNYVDLEDPKYFSNKSWTFSFNMLLKSWASYHNYIPNYFIGLASGNFLSGINMAKGLSSLWGHNVATTSFQTFYGKFYPYILEYPQILNGFKDEVVQNIEDRTRVLEYYNKTDFYEINDGVYFNKSILYNNQQCSGVLNLYPKPKGKMNFYFNYPKFNKDSKDITFTKSDSIFSYNTFWDVVKNPNNRIPIWIEGGENMSIGKILNDDPNLLDYSTRSFQKTKLRSKELKIRHINDVYSRYKMISEFILVPTVLSNK